MIKYLSAIFVILLSTTVLADSKIVGHMKPLEHELLPKPIKLKCGAVIKEWRGSNPNRKLANHLCTFTKDKFYEFVRSKGYKCNNSKFNYSMSFIPDDSKYRNLNDKDYRFFNRDFYVEVSGYTSHTKKYVFVLSNTNKPDFIVSIVHELYHAFSESYGVFEQLPGKTVSERAKVDESMAQEFTLKYLGKK